MFCSQVKDHSFAALVAKRSPGKNISCDTAQVIQDRKCILAISVAKCSAGKTICINIGRLMGSVAPTCVITVVIILYILHIMYFTSLNIDK
jgi:hypothetical protein